MLLTNASTMKILNDTEEVEEACDVLDENGRRETYSSGKEEVERTYPEVVGLLNQRYYNTTMIEKSNNQRENIFRNKRGMNMKCAT